MTNPAGASSSNVDLDAAHRAAADPAIRAVRAKLADYTASIFLRAGQLLHVGGHVIGPDRKEGRSPFGHGSDETVAVSLLLRIAAELISASEMLFRSGKCYAAAALLRQLVEIEYLAWAFDANDQDAERWLRSTRQEREHFFRPAKLRMASDGRFRGKDYGYHCELGGHPVPGGHILLDEAGSLSQLLLSDLLGHTGRIWDHVVSWGGRASYASELSPLNEAMASRYAEWKQLDPLTRLPPPP